MLDRIYAGLSPEDITRKRSEISEKLKAQSQNIRGGRITAISTADLRLMFELYDQVFFEDWFRHNFKGKLKFSLSRRMTKSAGMTICPKNMAKVKPDELVIEIRIGVDFFLNYDPSGRGRSVCGISTASGLEALQLVFEHELCHVIEFIYFGKSKCSGQRFKDIAGFFGHTESCHRLPTFRQTAMQGLGLGPGDAVSFTHGGVRLCGTLVNINRRATVMVGDENGAFVDRHGSRFAKYYVPLALLRHGG